MSDESAAAFWSYAREDDEHDGRRISVLADKLRAEYSLLTASPLQLFVDRDSIAWGDAWQERIDKALVGTTFFIPIITPRYFTRDACRQELLKFVGEARRLGLEQLLLPIYYIDVPELSSGDDPADEAMSLIKTYQWQDLRGVRLEDQGSAPYRAAVNRLAAAIAKRVKEVTEIATSAPPATSAGDPATTDEAEAPGSLEQLAQMEELIPRLARTLEEYSGTMQLMTSLTEEGVREIGKSDAQGKGFAGRLRAAERLAAALQEPATRLQELGASFAADLVDANPGVLTLIEFLSEEDENDEDVELFFKTLEELGESSGELMESSESVVQTLRSVGKLSRSMRKPNSAVIAGARNVRDAQSVIEGWASRARETKNAQHES